MKTFDFGLQFLGCLDHFGNSSSLLECVGSITIRATPVARETRVRRLHSGTDASSSSARRRNNLSSASVTRSSIRRFIILGRPYEKAYSPVTSFRSRSPLGRTNGL